MMLRRPLCLAAWVCVIGTIAGCSVASDPDEILVQRFFGQCAADFGGRTDVSAAEGECGIITTLINRFAAENPDVHVKVSTVTWPGYNQLSAQMAAGDAPDLVTMHQSVIFDYESRGLLEPMGEGLKAAGVDPATFTPAGLQGVSKRGRIYGMPFDTWAPLWHINLNDFAKAGLVRNGEPILPTSPEELLAQARQFKKATGKPYFVQSSAATEKMAPARTFLTYLMQQDANFFPDPQHIRLRTPEARRVVELFRQIYAEDLTTKNQDFSAATSAFMNGGGGVYLMGTWVIGDFIKESKRPERPLSDGYTVYTYPQLYPARNASFADGHAWVMPARQRTPAQRRGTYRLLRYLADNDFEWARTGHLPAFSTVIDSAAFKALPLRSNIAILTEIGTPLPATMQRQFSIGEILGEELASAQAGYKSVDAALADAEHRVNDLLFHLL